MIFEPNNEAEKKSRSRLTLFVVLVILVGLAGALGLNNSRNIVIEREALRVCGDGNVETVTATDFQCRDQRPDGEK